MKNTDDAWRARIEQTIGALVAQAYADANTKRDGTRRKRFVPYVLPDVAHRLVVCLDRNDKQVAESLVTHNRDIVRALSRATIRP